MYARILVASDGSGPSLVAAEIAGEIAGAFASKVTVVTVAYLPKAYATDISSDMQEGYLDEWKRVLADTAHAVAGKGVKPETKMLRDDEPASALLKEVGHGDYDLLVMGRTGAGNPGSKLMGGVSRKLAEAATCAVLLVR